MFEDPCHMAASAIPKQLNFLLATRTFVAFEPAIADGALLKKNPGSVGKWLLGFELKLKTPCSPVTLWVLIMGHRVFAFSFRVFIFRFSMRHPCRNLMFPCACLSEIEKLALFT